MTLGDFDSKEEFYFYFYLKELEKKNIISDIKYQYPKYTLSLPLVALKETNLKTKTKLEDYNLLKEHHCTPDFSFKWNSDYLRKAFNIYNVLDGTYYRANKIGRDYISIVDTKGENNNNPIVRHSHTVFAINQKWVYEKYNIFIQKIIVSNKKNSIFDKTFTPSRYLFTDKQTKTRAIHYNVKTINQWLQTINQQRN